ncbi:MAG: DUF4445 domain-containing protein [Phycisphaeraceae bacterium]|nr:DUF4445 domain-containing protein [Phycisphaeraceae bacterium]
MSPSVRLHVHAPDTSLKIEVSGDRLSQPLTQLLRHEGLPLNTRCGGRDMCQGCLCELVSGRLWNESQATWTQTDGQPVQLRACRHQLSGAVGRSGSDGGFGGSGLDAAGEVELRLPARSVLAHRPRVVDQFSVLVPIGHDPIVASTTGALGAAIDIGTTTVALALVDLADGRIVARSTDFNRQMHLGDDVLTRINLCAMDVKAAGRLQSALIKETLAPMLARALTEAGAIPGSLKAITCAGNTTMLHLLAGVDPTPLGIAPFKPVFLDQRQISARQLGIHEGDVPVWLLPSSAAYLGADLVGDCLISGMAYSGRTAMLVDVGTNGEVVLRHGDRLLGCATAAGPAFEGGRLTCGVRATEGAISRVVIHQQPWSLEIERIGDGRLVPIGLCGSACIDLLAQGRAAGLLDRRGRINDELTDALDAGLIDKTPGGLAMIVARKRGGHGRPTADGDIILTEADIAHLLPAKAAIAAGILTLMRRADITASDVDRLYLAGGFGMHLNVDHAIACGLLPGFRADQVEVIGNGSLAAAYVTLLDCALLDELAAIAGRIETVELNLDPGFEECFIDQLMLP